MKQVINTLKRMAVTSVLAATGLAGLGVGAASAACGPEFESVGPEFIAWGETAKKVFGEGASNAPEAAGPMVMEIMQLTTAASTDEITAEHIEKACDVLEDLKHLTEVKQREGLNAIFRNDTKYDALELKISSTDDYSQEENILGDDPLLPGQSITIYVTDDMASCNWTVFWKADAVSSAESVNLCKETLTTFQTAEASAKPAVEAVQSTALPYVYSLDVLCQGDIFDGKDTFEIDMDDQVKTIFSALNNKGSGVECKTLSRDNEFRYFNKAETEQRLHTLTYNCSLESTQSVTLDNVSERCTISGIGTEHFH